VTQAQEALLMIRGSIVSMPEKQQKIIKHVEKEIRELLEEYGDEAYMAICLIGAELAASHDNEV